ncbi:hypothetical protein LHGZ1_1968 [Laribacter hongkongensis]|uniref:Uncharacterized protein n=1 Tax=Laribacter hongkongensis TaxID=168471 RepID=A0A248LJW0_9NEIS|nr:hypothetical protein LHGZ1_1968 [Laribacter hongkongensis]
MTSRISNYVNTIVAAKKANLATLGSDAPLMCTKPDIHDFGACNPCECTSLNCIAQNHKKNGSWHNTTRLLTSLTPQENMARTLL